MERLVPPSIGKLSQMTQEEADKRKGYRFFYAQRVKEAEEGIARTHGLQDPHNRPQVGAYSFSYGSRPVLGGRSLPESELTGGVTAVMPPPTNLCGPTHWFGHGGKLFMGDTHVKADV